MAEEKQTHEPEQYNHDDIDVLRYVLKNVRGIAPVATYRQADFLVEDEEV